MSRIRALVNAELIAEKGESERTLQIGSGTYFEASKVETYISEKEVLADVTLLDGFKIIGVAWNPQTFENHGVPEFKITKTPEVEVIDVIPLIEPVDDLDRETLKEFEKQWGNNPTN